MSGSEEKTVPATKRKLAKQREKGIVPQAAEMANYLSQTFVLIFLVFGAKATLAAMQLGVDGAIASIGNPVEDVISDALWDVGRIYALSAVPVILLAMSAGVLITLLYQKGFLFAVDPLKFRLARINPATGFTRIFGKRGWIELGVSLVRIALWWGIFAAIIALRYELIIASTLCGIHCIVDVALWTVLMILAAAAAMFILFAMAEGLVQRFLFADDQKMTKTEVKQERKDQFGSPEVRNARKKFRKELEQEAENTGVDNATMGMFAGDLTVAIRYHPTAAPNPILAAKGMNADASRKIREQLRHNGYLETEHVKLVEGLMSVRVGKPVPPALHDYLREALYAMYG